MKRVHQILVFSIFLLAFQFNSYGQVSEDDTTKVSWDWYHVVKHNGVEYIAQIISDDGREVLIYTKELGKIYIPKSDIKSMLKIDNPKDVVYGEFRNDGPFTTRYFFTTNALPIKKGENYALVNLYGPEVHFAVTNSTSIGLMSTWIGSPIGLAVKQTFKTSDPKINFSIGTINGTSGYFNSFRGYGGLTFGNVTYGNRSANVTFSAGLGYFQTGRRGFAQEGYSEYPESSYYYGYDYGDLKEPTRTAAMFAVSGITKVGAKASFVFDVVYAHSTYIDQERTGGILTSSYYDANGVYVPGTYYQNVVNVKEHRGYLIIMPGMRFQKTDNHSFQFVLAGVTVFGTNFPITFPAPMCSWFYKF